jgi:hypothetical protein
VTQVALPTRVYVSGRAREAALDGLGSLIDNAVGDLDVETTVAVGDDQFPRVTIEPVDTETEDAVGETGSASGEGTIGSPGDEAAATGTATAVSESATSPDPDVTAARSVLAEEWGTVPDDPQDAETFTGTLEGWDDDGIDLAIGRGRTVRVPTGRLGLGQGTATQVVERFGLVQHVPLQVRNEDGALRLADATRDRLYDWRRGPERLNVNSTTRGGLRATINRAGHADDIVTIERQGLLEQSAIMGEGTEAPGLLAAIGPHLAAEMRCVR